MSSVSFTLTYLGEAVCFPAVPTANGRAFKSTRPVDTAQVLTGAGGALARLCLSRVELKSSIISQVTSFCLQVFYKKLI